MQDQIPLQVSSEVFAMLSKISSIIQRLGSIVTVILVLHLNICEQLAKVIKKLPNVGQR